MKKVCRRNKRLIFIITITAMIAIVALVMLIDMKYKKKMAKEKPIPGNLVGPDILWDVYNVEYNAMESRTFDFFPEGTFDFYRDDSKDKLILRYEDGTEKIYYEGDRIIAIGFSDLNHDGVTDMCIECSCGSGWINEYLTFYDFKAKESYMYFDRWNIDYWMKLVDGKLSFECYEKIEGEQKRLIYSFWPEFARRELNDEELELAAKERREFLNGMNVLPMVGDSVNMSEFNKTNPISLPLQYDITGDGVGDIFGFILYGSGMPRTCMVVYDYVNHKGYLLDGYNNSYNLERLEQGELLIRQHNARNSEDTIGKVVLSDGKLVFVKKNYEDEFGMKTKSETSSPEPFHWSTCYGKFFDKAGNEIKNNDEQQKVTLEEFPGVTFWADVFNLSYKVGEESNFIFSGMPITDIYFYDVNGDGYREVCASGCWGSGIIDESIIIFDYTTKKRYSLRDRMKTDFSFEMKNGELMVKIRIGYSENYDLGSIKITEDKMEVSCDAITFITEAEEAPYTSLMEEGDRPEIRFGK